MLFSNEVFYVHTISRFIPRHPKNLPASTAGRDRRSEHRHWVQFTEDSATTDFLKGGELIITTGMSAASETWLYDFITRLIAQKSAGLILNTGRYLFVETIPTVVIGLCNQHHFPLFAMPWKIPLATIMQDYGNRIFM